MSDSRFQNYYNDLASDPNNLSKWFPKIENCGIKVPRTITIPVLRDIVKSFL